jgi:signal transduction histidine kinase
MSTWGIAAGGCAIAQRSEETMNNGQTARERELEQQVATLQAQLEQAQTMTALGELAGTLAHELNNVLMKFIGYAQMGLRHKDDASREKSFQTILKVAERTKRMVAATLGMARNRSAKPEPTDLVPLVDDTLLLLERELNKHRVSVERDFQPVPRALANGNQIQQVLINLLINARQAMPEGGRVILRLKHDAENRMVELTVRDTGCGIPADKLRHIFEPMFTTKKPDATRAASAWRAPSARAPPSSSSCPTRPRPPAPLRATSTARNLP